MSRLSNRTTWKPRSASMLQKRSSQPSICTPSPMISSTVGFDGSPKVSYSSSMPLVWARGIRTAKPTGVGTPR